MKKDREFKKGELVAFTCNPFSKSPEIYPAPGTLGEITAGDGGGTYRIAWLSGKILGENNFYYCEGWIRRATFLEKLRNRIFGK